MTSSGSGGGGGGVGVGGGGGMPNNNNNHNNNHNYNINHNHNINPPPTVLPSSMSVGGSTGIIWVNRHVLFFNFVVMVARLINYPLLSCEAPYQPTL